MPNGNVEITTLTPTLDEDFLVVTEIETASEEVRQLDRTGLDGVAIAREGFKGQMFRLRLERDLSLADASAKQAKRALYMSMAGHIATITLDGNQQEVRTGISINAVRVKFEPTLSGIGGIVGSTANWWVILELDCIDTNVS